MGTLGACRPQLPMSHCVPCHRSTGMRGPGVRAHGLQSTKSSLRQAHTSSPSPVTPNGVLQPARAQDATVRRPSVDANAHTHALPVREWFLREAQHVARRTQEAQRVVLLTVVAAQHHVPEGVRGWVGGCAAGRGVGFELSSRRMVRGWDVLRL